MKDCFKAFAIILNWNGWADTISCIESLFASDTQDFGIILIDNDSRDASRPELRKWLATRAEKTAILTAERDNETVPACDTRIIYYENDTNVGFAAGCNLGIRLAVALRAEYCWLLNNDTVVEPPAFSHMMAMAESGVDLVGANLFYFDSGKWQGGGACIDYPTGKVVVCGPEDQRLTIISGASMLFHSSFVQRVGFFDERYFCYWEDIDLCVRAHRAGLTMAVSRDSIIHHKESASTKHISATKHYYMTRNLFLFLAKNHPYSWPIVLPPFLLRQIVKGGSTPVALRALGHAIRDAIPGKFGKAA